MKLTETLQVKRSGELSKLCHLASHVLLQEESYTSKCSFLDNEPIEERDSHAGIRISRGLFRSSNRTIINADINASYNIIKKTFPNSIAEDGIEGAGLHPLLVAI